MWAAGSATLEHVRLKRSPLEAPVARLRLSYLLSSVAFKPPAMPPSALLIVRSMRDPLPGRIAREFEVAAVPSFEWESAAESQLGALYRGAARPARATVPPSAEAVLFGDYGELLAALALDLLKGAANSWWWKSVLRRFPSRLPNAWADVWAEHPLYIPAALQHLEERGEAVAVLERIAPVQAQRLLLAVLRAYDLSELTLIVSQLAVSQMADTAPAPEPRVVPSPLTQAAASDAALAPDWDGPTEARGDSRSGSSHTSGIAPAPWEPYAAASSTPAPLGRARRALLGVSLLLRRAPQVAFSDTFPPRLRVWLEKELEREKGPNGADEPLITAAKPAVPGKLPIHAESMIAPATPSSGDPSALGGPHAKESARVQFDPFGGPHAKQSTRVHSEPLAEKSGSVLPDFESGELTVGPASSIEEALPPLQPRLEEGTLTYAGGVFYLIHFLHRPGRLGLARLASALPA
jgi:hypothetical protein